MFMLAKSRSGHAQSRNIWLTGRRRFFVSFCLASLALFCGSDNIWAKSYKIEIQPLYPQSDLHTTVCNDEYETCFLTLIFRGNSEKSETNEYIDVGVHFLAGVSYFQFMWRRSFLSVSSGGGDDFAMPLKNSGTERERIKLYIPHPLSKYDRADSLRLAPVVRISDRPLTELEISIEPEP